MERSQILSVSQSLARFAVVSVIEIFALALCYAPLFGGKENWQLDCIRLGIGATILALLIIVAVLIAFSLHPKPKEKPSEVLARQLNRWLEGGILTIYLLNIVVLECVIIRTGGPSASLYAPLIPIQLSGIIFLQIQKELLVENRGLFPFVCTLFACCAMLIGYWAPIPISTFLRFSKGGEMVDSRGWNTILTIAGMLLAFFAYWVPKQRILTERFARAYPRDQEPPFQPTL